MQVADVFVDSDGINITLKAENDAEQALLALVSDGPCTEPYNDEDGQVIAVFSVEERTGRNR